MREYRRKGGSMGWQYLLLFLVLTAPFAFWLYSMTAKTLRENYDYENEI